MRNVRLDQPRIEHRLKPSQYKGLHQERLDRLWNNIDNLIERIQSGRYEPSEVVRMDDRLHQMKLCYSRSNIATGNVKIPFRFLYLIEQGKELEIK
jgi:hypothetical protein